MGAMNFQVVVLAGGGGLSKKLIPLVSKDLPKALLPVGNRPLISYVLELLEASNIKDLIVVVAGDEAATQVENWISNAFDDRLNVEVVSVPEDHETADALRKISHRLTADDFLVVSGDLVSDVPLGAVAAAHRRQDAVVTALLCGRPKLNSSEGSTGGSSKDKTKLPVSDVIGLDSTHQHLLFLASSGQVEKELRMRRSLLRVAGNMEIRTDLVDAHLYAFKRVVVQEVLDSRPGIKCIKRDLVPFLIRSQLRLGSSPVTASVSEEGSDQPRGGSLENGVAAVSSLTDEVSTLLQRVCSIKPSPLKCCAYVASPGKFCARVNSLQAYGEVNRAVADEVIHLTGYKVSTHNNVVHETAATGSKTTVGPYCLVGEGSEMGDKCRIKRSVVGRHCRIGSNVTIVNSVIMDYVTIQDFCSIQSSVVCSNALLQERSSLKDCQVEASYQVEANQEYREEALVKKEKA
ncbi:translation initiation factor eIF-2B subunit gamma [Marchantia polymorpha subsp. ruderalis]|uniref:Translation initiation factor eIF2B subunit gamma n=2 Tax=Marchantia polymorpha TaxID=3197 RepID=A0A176VLP8_MARPO|nr:hypothetical protein AXG93_3833s1210 [Marchantia polymorpha subsp. ruderalis]PTQ35579.1 hypothetical protein MARPO_0070s0045 [Marchantia polymorpha]BBN08773.1 hypothetical protein Mp_4g14360 [Marchantia polymorpha subsp. ruderalis]|eukprot:PTQ35579.1 hypothetical protein MARPO_0070s0045 [Marchantia polymorpha]